MHRLDQRRNDADIRAPLLGPQPVVLDGQGEVARRDRQQPEVLGFEGLRAAGDDRTVVERRPHACAPLGAEARQTDAGRH